MSNIVHQFLTAGVRFYPAYKDLNLAAGDAVTLILEPDNKYAKHPAGAIAVAKNGVKFGHVPEVDLEKVHPLVPEVQALISYVDTAAKYPAVMIVLIT